MSYHFDDFYLQKPRRSGVAVGVSLSISAIRSKSNAKRKDKTKDNRDDTDDAEFEDGDGHLSFEKSVIGKLNRTEVDGQHARKMFEQILSYHDRHERTQKIFADIEESTPSPSERQSNNSEVTFPSELPYSVDDGKSFFDALLIPGDRTKKNLFALKLVDKVFSREEFLEIDPTKIKQQLLEHPSYAFIKDLFY
ncbi:unnamed protein product [Rotaria sordida]|uniref:Uncharacterized protein n=1 Tax=Rotaria sordida TaxID=392033 RepID=A0A819D6M3_9BILA|nr:unnamed protein product [Rotaria sordida]CAF1299105.1 unnamed protein product [Rotaria sordida]CAF1564055.1 unnamed protein product [Rotaria sordida]CAF3823335.1 unnamed protein product [Rotaria sordida]